MLKNIDQIYIKITYHGSFKAHKITQFAVFELTLRFPDSTPWSSRGCGWSDPWSCRGPFWSTKATLGELFRTICSGRPGFFLHLLVLNLLGWTRRTFSSLHRVLQSYWLYHLLLCRYRFAQTLRKDVVGVGACFLSLAPFQSILDLGTPRWQGRCATLAFSF